MGYSIFSAVRKRKEFCSLNAVRRLPRSPFQTWGPPMLSYGWILETDPSASPEPAFVDHVTEALYSISFIKPDLFKHTLGALYIMIS